jgi:hypothetical protein
LRYFAGLSIPETAQTLDISPRTADRLWAYARAFGSSPHCPTGVAAQGPARPTN